MNSPLGERTKAYRELATHFTDSYRESGWGLGLTFPYHAHWGNIPLPMPLVRIDYIFHSPDLGANQATVFCRGGSDHCYVISQLTGF
jgi:endonuclease/exonuclease/phosphatase family metal-dependent hydrolase